MIGKTDRRSSSAAARLESKLAEFFGATEGNLQEKIKGKKVVFCMEQRLVLRGFTPADEWDGPEMKEGDFLVHEEEDCNGCC